MKLCNNLKETLESVTPRLDTQDDLFKMSLKSANINGFYLEFGLFRGRTAKKICNLVPDKILYGFDSFNGVPEDLSKKVIAKACRLYELPIYHDNVRIVIGHITHSLGAFLNSADHINIKQTAFMHLDVACYSSTKLVLSLLKEEKQIVTGTVIHISHVMFPENGIYYDSVAKAFYDWVEKYNISYNYIASGHNGRHFAVVIK